MGSAEINCVKIELRGFGVSDDNSSKFPEHIKEELLSESEPEIKVFDDVSRRKGTNNTRKGKSSNNSSFVKNSSGEREVTTVEKGLNEKSSRGYYCRQCKIHFRFNNLYEGHFREKHPKTAPFSCQFCRSPQWFKKNYARHVRLVHPEKVGWFLAQKAWKIKCELCDTSYDGLYALDIHVLKVHEGVKTFKCAECDAKYFRSNHLKFHVRSKHRKNNEDDPFCCNICSNVFDTSDILESHKDVCKERQKLKKQAGTTQIDISELRKLRQRTACGECGTTLPSVEKLIEHTHQNHPNIGIFSCEKCDKSFLKSQSLEKHNVKYHPDSKEIHQLRKKFTTLIRYDCKFCDAAFEGTLNYEKHVITSHPDEKPFECTICGAGFKRKSSVTIHFKNVHEGGHLPCSYCSKYYGSEKGLKSHERACGKKCAKKEAFFCDICFKWRTGLVAKHKFQHEDFDYCEFCDERFHRGRNRRGLSKHMEKRHPNRVGAPANAFVVSSDTTTISWGPEIKRENTEMNDKLRRGATFNEDDLKLESLVRSSERTSRNQPKVEIFSCGKSFYKRHSKEIHDKKFHPNSEERHPRKRFTTNGNYACKVCCGAFHSMVNYEKHFVKFHPDQRAFECAACGAGFKRKSNLRLHFQNMHGTEILPCSYCNKCYGSKMVLKRHEKACGKKYVKKEAFFCDICLNWRTGSVDKHRIRHDDYDHCEFCEKRFHRGRNPRGLSKHMEKRHENRVNANVNA